MTYRSTRELVNDLRLSQQILVIDDPVDPNLELAEIHRRVYRRGGPALLFSNVIGSRFPVASNLFGTIERARFIFREQIDAVRMAVRLKTDPSLAVKKPWQFRKMPWVGWRMRPQRVRSGSVMQHTCQISDLPKVVCWPNDGGPFVTLPQVLSQMPGAIDTAGLNLGMYRVQLSGNDYQLNRECGLHYQIHRGIGIHHTAAIENGAELPVNVSVGGAPAVTLAAVMPLPEGMSELGFAGALAGHRIPLLLRDGLAPIYADADFCILGKIAPQALKPEGPFGDHLGYYARVHDFPYLQVQQVYHREGAIWPMTVVGRPPQEDTTFGQLIHEITEPVIPSVLPGVREVHAVDAAGVHPLLLAVGSERYTPYAKPNRAQETLTQALAIFGQGQLSLAKYLWIIDGLDQAAPSAANIEQFFQYFLQRADWQNDLHFLTRTTIDTLDYSGDGLNQGSKLILACGRPVRRELSTSLAQHSSFLQQFSEVRLAMPGVVAVSGLKSATEPTAATLRQCCDLANPAELGEVPLIVVTDDAHFATDRLDNFLWVTFTRSNPAADVYGIGARQQNKHFGCDTLVIDARSKPHHAPGLIEDPAIMAKVDARATRGDELAQYL